MCHEKMPENYVIELFMIIIIYAYILYNDINITGKLGILHFHSDINFVSSMCVPFQCDCMIKVCFK